MAEAPDLSGIISKLTEDPETLGKVMNLASSLMGNMQADTSESTQTSTSPPENNHESSSENQASAFDPTMLASLLGGLGATAGNKKDNGGKSGDSRTALLLALKPYMSEERAEKIDMMIKAMKLANIAGGLLGNSELLK